MNDTDNAPDGKARHGNTGNATHKNTQHGNVDETPKKNVENNDLGSTKIKADQSSAKGKHTGTPNTDADSTTERRPISDCCVFASVMENNHTLCKQFAELVIGKPIGEIKSVVAEYVENTVVARSVRFDAYLESDKTLVDIEMQVAREPFLAQRLFYYMSWLTVNTESLRKGDEFAGLPRRYIIFVCLFDPGKDNDPVYEISNYMKGTYLRAWDDGASTYLLNTKGDLTRTNSRIAEVLQYIETGALVQTNDIVMSMHEGIDEVYSKQDWRSDMNSEIFDRAALKEEGRVEGRAEGQTAERAREAALLEAMSEQGCSDADILSAMMHGNRDELYREYGIECN